LGCRGDESAADILGFDVLFDDKLDASAFAAGVFSFGVAFGAPAGVLEKKDIKLFCLSVSVDAWFFGGMVRVVEVVLNIVRRDEHETARCLDLFMHVLPTRRCQTARFVFGAYWVTPLSRPSQTHPT
jgi:hypothetical protein